MSVGASLNHKPVKITYYLEVISSWCMWAEPAWAQLRAMYEGRVDFGWKIALMDPSGLPVSRSQCEWFYRRSGTIVRSPFMLNSGWFDPALTEYFAPNAITEAGRDFGINDDRIRLAIARAALLEGRRVGEMAVSIPIAAGVAGVDAAALHERATSEDVNRRMRETTAEFHAFKMTQRPSFLIENCIGDRIVLSGTYRVEPIAAAIDSLLADAEDYAAYAAHHGAPPNV